MNTSKNDRAALLMGYRDTDKQPIDSPPELGYHCPVCRYKSAVNGNYDERVEWSEYNGFLWCSVCNKDYPSALCLKDIDRAITIFLDTVEAVLKARAARGGAARARNLSKKQLSASSRKAVNARWEKWRAQKGENKK